MPRKILLDERLTELLNLILRWAPSRGIHADIGSDHGGLLQHLCQSGHVASGIAVENKTQPLRNSQASLAGLPVDVRFGDGLAPVAVEEAESLSMSGMGGRTIVRILQQDPSKLSPWLFLQPNKDPDLVRKWARASQFHLVEERLTQDLFVLMVFHSNATSDPAYAPFSQAAEPELLLEAALLFGPRLLAESNRYLLERLKEERVFYGKMPRQTAVTARRIRLIQAALEFSNCRQDR